MGNNICFDEKKPRDPITLSQYENHKFVFVRRLKGNETVKVEYNVSSLVDYFLTSGDFLEPETRLEFTDEDLLRLDEQARKAGFRKPSVYEAKQNREFYLELKSKRDILIGLERLAGDEVAAMLTVVEKMSSEEGQMELVCHKFPAFIDFYSQMQKIDKDYSKQCLLHYQLYLKGPPNKPTQDSSGLLKVVLQFLKDVLNDEKVQQKQYGFKW